MQDTCLVNQTPVVGLGNRVVGLRFGLRALVDRPAKKKFEGSCRGEFQPSRHFMDTRNHSEDPI